ncbi:NADP-dependent oxidoreductase [Mobilicoccus pelagius]|uniref:Putative oxidoreductase n=1 Tax=Mobilicoccus pelagius NBRC 104925 TaxID=1089455 RepID=H5UVQ3_9MICO|nr:NADP-dependent oxidoreductase [Mobilicoccus pelagius]GAB49811.1 putative oxidoreductase [Mobilicoccus pelagius NBRC 104925]
MRAAVIHRFGGPEEFEIEDLPTPTAGEGEVVVRVTHAAVNPLDFKIRDGSSGMAAQLRDEDFPLVLGRECAGVVHEVGEGVTDFAPGDRVFGMAPPDHKGHCYAEFVSMPASALAHSPAGVDDVVLAGLSLVGLTAWIAVEDLAKVGSDDVVLVHGGGGGVGFMAVQLAKEAGAKVYATASARNADRLQAVGATPIDYARDDFTQVTPRPSVIVDCVYFDTYEPSMDHLADGGRLVLLPSLADVRPAKERGIDVSIPRVAPDRTRLDALATAVAEGRLTLTVADVLPLAEVAEAHRIVERGHTPGKIVLRVAGE